MGGSEGCSSSDVYVTLINDSKTEIHGGNLHFSDDGCASSIVNTVAPGQKCRVSPHVSLNPNCLRLFKVGAWSARFDIDNEEIEKDTQNDRISVRNGDVVRIIDDDKNPSLTPQEHQTLDMATLRRREEGEAVFGGFHSWDMAKGEDEFWRKFANQFGRECHYKLKALFMDQRYEGPRYNWYDIYQAIASPSLVKSSEELVSLLAAQERYDLHVYWRSLDRSTGGWPDELSTVRYAFQVFPQRDGLNTRASALACLHDDWYEKINLYGPYIPTSVTSALPTLHEKLLVLLSSQTSNNATYNIVDTVTESVDELDQEWSSVEVLLFVPDGSSDQDQLVFRLHQDCLWGEQHRLHKQRQIQPVWGTESQKELVSFCSDHLVDIGCPSDWTWDDGDPPPDCLAFQDFMGLYEQDGVLQKRFLGQSFQFPMHFRF